MDATVSNLNRKITASPGISSNHGDLADLPSDWLQDIFIHFDLACRQQMDRVSPHWSRLLRSRAVSRTAVIILPDAVFKKNFAQSRPTSDLIDAVVAIKSDVKQLILICGPRQLTKKPCFNKYPQHGHWLLDFLHEISRNQAVSVPHLVVVNLNGQTSLDALMIWQPSFPATRITLRNIMLYGKGGLNWSELRPHLTYNRCPFQQHFKYLSEHFHMPSVLVLSYTRDVTSAFSEASLIMDHLPPPPTEQIQELKRHFDQIDQGKLHKMIRLIISRFRPALMRSIGENMAELALEKLHPIALWILLAWKNTG